MFLPVISSISTDFIKAFDYDEYSYLFFIFQYLQICPTIVYINYALLYLGLFVYLLMFI